MGDCTQIDSTSPNEATNSNSSYNFLSSPDKIFLQQQKINKQSSTQSNNKCKLKKSTQEIPFNMINTFGPSEDESSPLHSIKLKSSSANFIQTTHYDKTNSIKTVENMANNPIFNKGYFSDMSSINSTMSCYNHYNGKFNRDLLYTVKDPSIDENVK